MFHARSRVAPAKLLGLLCLALIRSMRRSAGGKLSAWLGDEAFAESEMLDTVGPGFDIASKVDGDRSGFEAVAGAAGV